MKRSLIALAINAAVMAPTFAQDVGNTGTTVNLDGTTTTSTTTSTTSTINPDYARWDDNPANRRASWVPGLSYGYVGGGVGRSVYEDNCGAAFGCDRRDTSWTVFTGGQFSRVFGVELGYVNLGEAQMNGGDERAQGVDLDLVANLPLGEYFNLFVKGGGIEGWTHTSTAVPGVGGNDNGLNWTWGAGAQVDFNRSWALRLDWDRYRFDYANEDDARVGAWTANVVFKY